MIQEQPKHELDDLKGERNYRGTLVRRIIGGFEIWGLKCLTGAEVDEAINQSYHTIEQSIASTVTVRVGFSVSNTENK